MRKHGKLMSFLRTFFSHRPPRNQLKQSGIVKERVFGCDLGEHLLNSGHDVPLLLKSCTDIIEEYGIVHGIYRLSGITSNIQKLRLQKYSDVQKDVQCQSPSLLHVTTDRLAFDEDRVPDLTDECYLQDIHSISSLLKMYFRELPNPLLTYQLYDKTTEYLMRHLARVAAFGPETEMHSKNLAIVWAPNLLRSKELEAGGGAAALQGVGIQAVVTECLICYCDIIFSDKMPNYSSLDSASQKKPRPKSLAISTPTRLLSLEEARERAFIGNLANLAPKKFIDVGGGPKNLPSKYHTVIDLPGYKKKVNSSSKENKPSSGSKKAGSGGGSQSSSGGWKSIFSKPRGGSVKKARKPSQESVTLGPVQAKALTEEDVHNWKRHHLRSAKSAESLFTPTSPHSSPSVTSMNVDGASGLPASLTQSQQFGRKESKGSRPLYHHLSHKRSLSSDASTVLKNRQVNHDTSSLASPSVDFDEENSPKQFTREDSKRKAVHHHHHHRRIPSAPNTPRQDRKPPCPGRSSSVSKDDDSSFTGEDMDISLDDFIYPKSESRGDINIDAAINSRLLQVAEKTRSAKSNEELASSPLKRSANTPPKGRKKAKAENQNSVSSPQELSPETSFSGSNRRVHRSSSDVSRGIDASPYDNDDRESRMRRFYSRFHDYAEILSVDDANVRGQGLSGSSSSATPGSQGTPGSMSVSSSGCNMQDVLDQIDSRLAVTAKMFPRQQPTSSPKLGSSEDQQQLHRLSNGIGEAKETVFSSSVHTTTSTRPDNNKNVDLSLNLLNSTGPVERKVSPSSSLRQTEFPASVDTSPRELIEQETMRKLLGLDPPGDGSSKTAGGSWAGGTTPDQPGAIRVPSSSSSSNSLSAAPISSTRVVRRRAEFIPSASASGQDLDNLNDLLDSLERQEPRTRRRSSRKKGSQRSTAGGNHSSSSSSARPSPVSSQLQSPSSGQHQHHQQQHHNYNHLQHQGNTSAKTTSPRHIQERIAPGTESQAQSQAQAERCLQARLLASTGASAVGGITKCLSVPSDIARSLENVTGSQTDMMSSVTISELSASMSSFSNGGGVVPSGGDQGGITSAPYPGPAHHLTRHVPGSHRDRADPRHRRSSSLDSLSDNDRLMTRTLRDINRQMDAAFRHDGSPGRDSSLTRHHRLAASDLELSTSPEVRAAPHLLLVRGDNHGAVAQPQQQQQQQQQAQDESQWVSSDSIGQFQASDQSVTPTQATMDEAFKLFSQKGLSEGEGSHKADPTKCRSNSESSSDSDQDDEDQAAGLVLGEAQGGAFLDVNLMLSPPNLPSAAPEVHGPSQNQLVANRSVGQALVQQHSEKQTRPHQDDQIVVESPQLARARTRAMTSPDLARAPPSRPHHHHHQSQQLQQHPTQHPHPTAPPHHPHTHHHHHHHHHHAHHPNHRRSKKKTSVPSHQSSAVGRADVANMCINRSSSSSSSTSSSEEFDKVASPDEDDEAPMQAKTQNQLLQRTAGSGRDALTLPVGALANNSSLPSNSNHGLGIGSGTSDLSPSDPAVYAVIRRQHSPRSPNPSHGFPLGQGSGEAELNRSWELDGESERMSSLCAAGLMSQRARLSRESSTSSLQQSVSPDSSLSHAQGHVRSPLATPGREALPDIIQSATPQASAEGSARVFPIEVTAPSTEPTVGLDREVQDYQTANSNIAPLHLALYHPDEFSMVIPPAAVSGPSPSPRQHVNVHPSPSMPQVNSTQHDPGTEGKPPLRKSSTDNAISSGRATASYRPVSERTPSRPGAGNVPMSSSADLQIVSGNIRIPTSLSMDSAGTRQGTSQMEREAGRSGSGALLSPQTFRSRAGSDSRAVRAAAHQLQLDRYRENMRASNSRKERDHDAMEVDNLCNRLVDRLTSPNSRRAPLGGSPGNPETIFSQAVPRSPRREICQPLAGPSSQPMPAERGIVRSFSTSSASTGQTISGNEEAENILNSSRELLQCPVEASRGLGTDRSAHSSPSGHGAGALSLGQPEEKKKDSLTPASESGIPVRKSSFSKIPRPRQMAESPSLKSPGGGGSLRRGETLSTTPSSGSSSMSSSTHADFSPSSSSTSSSTASPSSRQALRSRRASETPGIGKRSSQSRRMSDTPATASPGSQRSQPPPASFSRSNSGGSGRGRQNLESKAQTSGSPSTSSRIPLSHRVPSPQGVEASPNLSLPRQASKTKSPTPKPRKSSFNAKSDQPKGQSTSSDGGNKGDTTPRQATRREATSRGAVSGGRAGATGRKDSETNSSNKRAVLVKSLADENGAKLVIETQPELKKKVQTVHAKKVSQPARQVAAGVDGVDSNDRVQSSSGECLESGQASANTGSGSSVTFSGDTYAPSNSLSSSKKVPPPVAKRKFRYDSKSLPRKPKQAEGQSSGEEAAVVVGSCPENSAIASPPRTLAEYADLVGSRSSLDESVLQLAAERQEDLFSPEELAEHQKHYGCSTGSLRAKRSVKLQSLLDLFEHKDSDSNVSDSSCGSPKTQPRDRLHSGSAGVTPLTPCLEDGVPGMDDDDDEDDASDPFSPSASLPDSAPTTRSSERRRSRSGDVTLTRSEQSEGARGEGEVASVMMRSMPEPRGLSPRRQDRQDLTSRRVSACLPSSPSPQPSLRQPSPSQRRQHVQSCVEPSRETRPPRYRTNPRNSVAGGETDMSGRLGLGLSHLLQAGGSDNTPAGDTPRAVLMRAQSSPDKDWRSEGNSMCPPSSPQKSVERRNSIKDLLQVFERQDSDTSSQLCGTGDVTPQSRRVQPRERLGSSSPPSRERQERGAISMRLSLEIPTDSYLPSGPLSSGPFSQADVKSQPMRLGPKPFYGASK
ncbi:rho GTPase-activating protein [Elysia marginata]|uniref:Rho GTPase-activating protein n=1 Tax=Elysia marginata TaxID=1093978 RepID=A0AAV4ICY8_9GAST|nr:rho GTPase-activating protein [Elysia marginata]